MTELKSNSKKSGSVIYKALIAVPPLTAVIVTGLTAYIAYQTYTLEMTREQDLTKRLTFQELRAHRLRLSEIGTVFFCGNVLLKFDESVRNSTLIYRGNDKEFECEKGWCSWYRRCIGVTSEEVPDGSNIRITEDIARHIALPIRTGVDSYESLAHLACVGGLNKNLVLSRLKRELHTKNAIVRFIAYRYPPDEPYSVMQLPGLTSVLGELFPNFFESWKGRWKNGCSTPSDSE